MSSGGGNTPRSSDIGAGSTHGNTGKPSRGMGIGAIIGVIALFGLLLALGLGPRLKLKPQLAHDANEAKTTAPIVTYVMPKAAPTTSKVDLPGTVQGTEQTAISARATGYVRKWYVDIGDHVKAGQVLALIETPDTDAQVAQARAQVSSSVASSQQAKANTYMMIANADQASANISKAQAAYEQAKSDLSHAQVAEAQAKQQADQQKAMLKSSQANLGLAKTTATSYNYLAEQGAVAKLTAQQQQASFETNQAGVESQAAAVSASVTNIQAAHQTVLSGQANVQSALDGIKAARAAYAAAQANVKASQAGEGAATANIQSNQANLNRNDILQGFQKVLAPFDGIITDRNAEVGSLVSAAGGVASTTGDVSINNGSSAASSATTSLFSMVRTNTVRVFISVPENFVGAIRPGQSVSVSISELGNKAITGRINRDSSVLDSSSRTLLTQIDVPNPGGKLRPGMYATVSMQVPQTGGGWRIPDTALISDGQGNRVATITSDDTLHYVDVVVGRDFGKEMDITSGLTGNERLVANPSNGLTEGEKVQAEKQKLPAAPGAPAKPDAGSAAPASAQAPQADNAAPTAGGQAAAPPASGAATAPPNGAPAVTVSDPQGVNGGTPVSPTTQAPVPPGAGTVGGK